MEGQGCRASLAQILCFACVTGLCAFAVACASKHVQPTSTTLVLHLHIAAEASRPGVCFRKHDINGHCCWQLPIDLLCHVALKLAAYTVPSVDVAVSFWGCTRLCRTLETGTRRQIASEQQHAIYLSRNLQQDWQHVSFCRCIHGKQEMCCIRM